MNAKRFVLCLFMFVLLGGTCFISCGNAASKVSSTKEKVNVTQADKDFQSFLEKFTSSATFQYTRVKFPLKTPIALLSADGNSEKTFPFTKEKWPLLDVEILKEERITQEEGGVYVSKFVIDEPAHKEFEAGYEASEVDLKVVFDLIDGDWYVTDCYTAWYSFDLPISELKATIEQVQEENKAFEELHP
ncbi:DUF4348 domain-containing protein [uncultured Bacteroides sp.]|uniref:DUF4348 domain-containing protein n=1 Tax=uncultured Bacteroides sp. TaxID=162156 RepID=UPI002AAB0F3A|nr:DUF4348 domain-containing protein [uncultured Bacteroides sp.]